MLTVRLVAGVAGDGRVGLSLAAPLFLVTSGMKMTGPPAATAGVAISSAHSRHAIVFVKALFMRLNQADAGK
jgi:hypothetical protein